MPRKIAIVGLGPRGLYALENLVVNLSRRNALRDLRIYIFESNEYIGSSWVYELNQNEANWINLTERLIELPERPAISQDNLELSEFPTYHEWAEVSFDNDDMEDRFPPRKKVGAYLRERAKTLCDVLKDHGMVVLIRDEVRDLHLVNGKWSLTTSVESSTEVNEVLLCVGHQSTKNDDQIKNWQAHLKDTERLITEAYPIRSWIHSLDTYESLTIGIRGFGLAFIDVCRALALRYGNFHRQNGSSHGLSYESDKNFRIIPFSLDGLPMAPKPINKSVDNRFAPTQKSLDSFKKVLQDFANREETSDIEFLLEAFCNVVIKTWRNKSDNEPAQLENIVPKWLRDDGFEHDLILHSNTPALDQLKAYAQMALGQEDASLDFFIGQVWRHCQPDMYHALEFNSFSAEVVKKLVEFDERLKRYAYGPPLESILQLIALEEAEILDLQFLKDPDIEIELNKWQLTKDEAMVEVDFMIDSVLSAPNINDVSSELISNLRRRVRIETKNDQLGVNTDKSGYVIADSEEVSNSLALVGRLAKGTLIGVDALLECFGNPPVYWARQASENHLKHLSEK